MMSHSPNSQLLILNALYLYKQSNKEDTLPRHTLELLKSFLQEHYSSYFTTSRITILLLPRGFENHNKLCPTHMSSGTGLNPNNIASTSLVGYLILGYKASIYNLFPTGFGPSKSQHKLLQICKSFCYKIGLQTNLPNLSP